MVQRAGVLPTALINLRTETDSYTAWDGRRAGWYVFTERDWRNLYLAPAAWIL